MINISQKIYVGKDSSPALVGELANGIVIPYGKSTQEKNKLRQAAASEEAALLGQAREAFEPALPGRA